MVKKILVSVLILTGAAVAAFVFIFNGPESKIRKQLEFAAGKIGKVPGESPLISGARAKSLTKVFADGCLFTIPAHGVSKKIASEDLPETVLLMQSRYSELSVTLKDLSVDRLDENSSHASATAIIQGVWDTGERFEDFHELSCSLEQTEGIWKLVAVELVQVLEK